MNLAGMPLRGTFAAFWVVTSDFAYPNMLVPVASLFGVSSSSSSS